MAINSLSGYSPARISGINSGMDTDSMVANLMKVQQLKLDKVYKSKTQLEWKRDAYNESIKMTKDFRAKFMSVLSPDNMFSTSVYQTNKINYQKNNFVDIVAKANASKLDYEIRNIKLAQAAKVEGDSYVSKYAGIEGSKGTNMEAVTTGTKELSANAASQELKDLTFADGTKVFNFANADDKLSFSVNGKTFVFEQSQTMQDVLSEVSDDTDANVTMSIEGTKVKFRSDVIGSGATLNFANVGANEVFGTNSAFGIDSFAIGQTNAVKTGMTFKDFEIATGKSFGFSAGGTNKININGMEFSYTENDTIDSLMQKVNNAVGSTGVKMHYNDKTDQFNLRSTQTGNVISASDSTGTFFGAASGIAAGSSSGVIQVHQTDSIFAAAQKMNVNLQTDGDMLKFSINGEDFSFDIYKTNMSTMTTAINTNTKANVSFGYSSVSDSFTFTSRSTGDGSDITVANGTNSNAFGTGGFFAISALSAVGSDSSIEISDGRLDASGNKVFETIKNSSNDFSIDGIDYKLKANMAPGTDSVKYNVTQDNTNTIAKVKTFVEEYNKLVKSLTAEISEKKSYKYPPLSEEERKSLSEKDLAAYDEKSKQGVLKNDSDISSLMSNLRSQLNVKVGDTGLSAADIGFRIGTSVYSADNEIVFDEEKFKAALEKNPEAVTQVMTASSTDKALTTDSNGYTKKSKNGWITSISDITSNFEKKLSNNALKNTNANITDTDEKMDTMIKKMYIMEEKYWAQFARMEKILGQYQSQGNWLSSQLGM